MYICFRKIKREGERNMRKRIISFVAAIAMTVSLCGALTVTASAAAPAVKYQSTGRLMEELNRGLVAVYTTADTREQTVNGVYLSWRLFGTESLDNQAFDIYKNGSLLTTTGVHAPTNYIDTSGKTTDKYKVVPAGTDASAEPEVTPFPNNYYAKPSEVGNGNSLKNSFTYMDIPIERPDPVERMGDGKTSYYYTIDKDHDGGANDASVGDIDGDGDYEIILKWDPTDSKDSAGADFTGNCYIDAYEIDPNNKAENNANGHLYKWRIDLGKNVTSGAHYTQFIVYDFDGDGKCEMACKTAPGSVDGTGHYVSEVGDTDAIRNVDNTKQFIGTSGRLKGKNPFTQYLTVFDCETGAALWTTEYIPYEAAKDKYWGDGSAKYNRSERYLAGVAYLDGVHPSIIMCRGYYHDAIVRAYNWDGTELTMLWEHNGSKKAADSLYGQGNHQLSISDIDNDGKDEIVYGSAALDDNGVGMGNTYLGHGDAMHVSDFNNDGVQEVFSVKEDGEGFKHYAEDLRVAATGEHFWDDGKIVTTGDNGRGVMDNIDDAYALEHPNALALGWSSGLSVTHDFNGDDVATKPASAGSGSFDNSLVYWDGDLGRELLDANIIQKYDAANGWTKRFYGPSDGYTLTGGSTNNYTKRNASLSCDLWGDWREEVIMPVGKAADATPYLRIFTSTMWTDYRLTTLMHDSQYRCAIAWQNVAYNQPPHTSYYIGSAALAKDGDTTLNYLAPATAFTKVVYELENVPVTGMTITEDSVTVEKGKTVSINTVITPSDATKKGITWVSSNENVAKVSNGIVTGVGNGTATITATAKDTTNGTFTDTCEVTVFSNPVTGIILSDDKIDIGAGYTKKLEATVTPADATDSALTWTSDDESIASVAADGTVTGVGFGKTTVTAAAADGIHKASCIVKVKPITETDKTGDNVFVTTNTDTTSVLSNSTVTGASFVQTNAKVGGVFYKTFEPASSGKAKLSFKFTTGGTKIDGTNWNWTGHEFSLYVKLLGKDNANILTICQPFAAKAGTMTSKAATADEATFANDWTAVVENIGTVQGSAKRWRIDAEFDYDNNKVNAVLYGYGDGFDAAATAQYTKSFDLPEGVNFEKLSIESTLDNSSGDIVWQPSVQETSYSFSTSATGNSESLYERGFVTSWSENDLTDWVQTNTTTASLAYDDAEERILYNPTQPGSSYDAKKTINGVSDDSLLMYNTDWYFGSSVDRDGSFEYIQFGSKIRIGWTNGYKTYVSTDGGTTWNDNDNDGTVDSIFDGGNTTFTKNIKIIVDTKTKKIKSFVFDGTAIPAYADYQLADEAKFDEVTLGFSRAGASPAWAVPNGITNINVAQFTYGEEVPDMTELIVTGKTDKTANIKYAIVGDDTYESLSVIGALYDGDKLVEIKSVDITDTVRNKYTDSSLTFENNVSDYNLKVMMWDNMEIPVVKAAK